MVNRFNQVLLSFAYDTLLLQVYKYTKFQLTKHIATVIKASTIVMLISPIKNASTTLPAIPSSILGLYFFRFFLSIFLSFSARCRVQSAECRVQFFIKPFCLMKLSHYHKYLMRLPFAQFFGLNSLQSLLLPSLLQVLICQLPTMKVLNLFLKFHFSYFPNFPICESCESCESYSAISVCMLFVASTHTLFIASISSLLLSSGSTASKETLLPMC